LVFTWFKSFESTSEDKVINIKDKDYEMDSYFLGIYIRIIIASRESSGNKKVVHFGIPISRSFLETIKRFINAETKARVILDIARKLFHVDFFLQISMQKGGFNIHLMDLPFM
jgi:hypothetical protein